MDTTLAHLHEVTIPRDGQQRIDILAPVPPHAPAFVRDVLGALMAGYGDSVPTSALPPDGTFPTGTAKWEKRNIAQQIPVWDEDLCIQCGKCVLVCPHAVIRAKVYEPESPRRCTCDLQVSDAPMARPRSDALHAASGARGLHRMPPVRRSVPGQKQERGAAQGDQHVASAANSRRGGEELGFLLVAAGVQSRQPHARASQRCTTARAAVRIFRGVRGMRRDPLHQAAHPTLRRSAADCERDRMLLYIRRQFADHALHLERRRPRAGVVKFLVRRQCRVRARDEACARQAV